jgi:hypothetical protein
MTMTTTIEPATDELASKPAGSKLGPKPNMCWLPKNQLQIDKRYQRQLTSSRSKKLISDLRENFCWTHCAPLVVTENGDGTYNIVDGQHRWKAAMDIAEVSLLPCMVHEEMSLREQAHAFVAHNAARVPVNPLAIFHARAVAGEQVAVDIIHAAKQAGVSIVRSHQSLKNLAPNQTVALGVLTRIYRAYDDRPFAIETITEVLKVIREAYGDKVGQLTSGMIGGVWELMALDTDRDALIDALKRTDDAALSLRARELQFANPELGLRNAYQEALKELLA